MDSVNSGRFGGEKNVTIVVQSKLDGDKIAEAVARRLAV
jgi:hypothetical protein